MRIESFDMVICLRHEDNGRGYTARIESATSMTESGATPGDALGELARKLDQHLLERGVEMVAMQRDMGGTTG